MNVLVTGGAGYIGSVVAEELVDSGHHVIILDNLQQGHIDAVPAEAEFILADIGNGTTVDSVLQRFNIAAVMHMAAETVVEHSMTDPRRFFQNNIAKGLVLLDAMLKNGIRRIIFSSSAAVYGNPETIPIEENHPKKPLNAYGDTKLMFEKILEWYGWAYGLQHVSLRYFNAAGATDLSGEEHNPETHLIPKVLQAALDKSKTVTVFGTDCATRDGSCVRDYIHVADIARAHLLALDKLDHLTVRAYNLGNGNGYSVLEVIDTATRVTGSDIRVTLCDRRAGDPGELVASSELARAEIGWKPQFELEAILESAWKWTLKHPAGYGCEHVLAGRGK